MPKHQNAPTWVHSGVRDEEGGEGTPECALVGTFWCSGCGECVWQVGNGISKRGRGGDVPNSKNMPFWVLQTCFLGLERLGTHQTRKTRSTAHFLCLVAQRGET